MQDTAAEVARDEVVAESAEVEAEKSAAEALKNVMRVRR